jgi:hypothetical protein
MNSKEQSVPESQGWEDWLWDRAEDATTQIAQRIEKHLSDWPMVHFLMRHFGSLLFGAGQKLIQRQKATGDHRARDEAVIITCSRLFNDCFAGYELARRGLVLQAIVVLRSAFETSTQGIAFLESDGLAERWLEGARIRPSEVRQLTAMPENERNLYKKLAGLAHPNYEALRYMAAPVPNTKTGVGRAYAYGGWYAPKEAAQVSMQLLWAQLVFLERFYDAYSADLGQYGLLWAKGVENHPNLTWKVYLDTWRKVLTDMTVNHASTMPPDIVDIALSMSDYTPDQKEEFRRGFYDGIRNADKLGPNAEG